MITLNNKQFAENESEFVNSLFTAGSTCAGYARKNKRTVTLLNMQKEKIGVINQHGVLCCATKLKSGGYWYTHADIKEVGRYESYMQQVNECKAAISEDIL